MGRKRAASPTGINIQPVQNSIEWPGNNANGPLSKICHLPKKQRRGGRLSKKDGATRSKKAPNMKTNSDPHHESGVRPSARDHRVLINTARCNACLKAEKYCSCMHLEVAIQEYSFYIELPQNTHEVYMTAVENFRNHKVLLSFGGSAGIEEKLAECRKALHRNQIGNLIVHLYGYTDPLVWNTLNDVFRITQDPRVNTEERGIYQRLLRVWVLAHGALVLERVSWKHWEQALLQAYDTLSRLILQKSPRSELLFYRALFIWTNLPPAVENPLYFDIWQHLEILLDFYREMLPKQRGRRPPSSFRMAKMLNRRVVMGKLKRFSTQLAEKEWFELDTD